MNSGAIALHLRFFRQQFTPVGPGPRESQGHCHGGPRHCLKEGQNALVTHHQVWTVLGDPNSDHFSTCPNSDHFSTCPNSNHFSTCPNSNHFSTCPNSDHFRRAHTQHHVRLTSQTFSLRVLLHVLIIGSGRPLTFNAHAYEWGRPRCYLQCPTFAAIVRSQKGSGTAGGEVQVALKVYRRPWRLMQ